MHGTWMSRLAKRLWIGTDTESVLASFEKKICWGKLFILNSLSSAVARAAGIIGAIDSLFP